MKTENSHKKFRGKKIEIKEAKANGTDAKISTPNGRKI